MGKRLNFYDKLNYAKKLNPRKIRNALEVVSSFYYSRYLGRAKPKGLPLSLTIEPTTACNLRCPQCPSGLRSFSRPTGKVSEDLFKQTIDELKDTLLYLLIYFQGEPYLHPQFLDLVQYASERKIYTATSTNAHFLDSKNARRTVSSGLDRLIISLDGTTQESYESYRVGGSLEKVISGIKELVYWKKEMHSKTPHLILQFLVLRANQHQIEEVKQLGKSLGVPDVRLKTAQVYDYEQDTDFIPTIPKYARYQQTKPGDYQIKNKFLNHCWRMWHSCVITWDGSLVPCCFDKDAKHVLGSLQTGSFKEQWQGIMYNQFRNSLLKSRSEIDICKNCTEGTKVWI